MTNKHLFTRGYKAPEFCIITPTAYLDQYAVQSKTHLVLAHLVEQDQVYADFYKQRSEAGDRIILDNGAFECGESYTPERLIPLANRIGAHALVLPDYPFQPSDVTIKAAEQWIPSFKEAGLATFFVPQSETGNLEDWIASYQWAAANPNIDIIGLSILGVPNAMPHIPYQYARVVMAQILNDRGIVANKHHHCLGLNAGPNVEIPSLIKLGVLDTCDSSNPVWCGVNGIAYDVIDSDWMGVNKKYLRHVDFSEKLTDKPHIHELIQHNIDLTLGLFE